MPAKAPDVAKYRQKLKLRAFQAIGAACVFCKTAESIQAAHVLATGLKSAGRGMDRRYQDVLKHPDKYRPMCKNCHRTFDALRKLYEAQEPREEIPF